MLRLPQYKNESNTQNLTPDTYHKHNWKKLLTLSLLIMFSVAFTVRKGLTGRIGFKFPPFGCGHHTQQGLGGLPMHYNLSSGSQIPSVASPIDQRSRSNAWNDPSSSHYIMAHSKRRMNPSTIVLPKSETPSRVTENIHLRKLPEAAFEKIEKAATSHKPERGSNPSKNWGLDFDIFDVNVNNKILKDSGMGILLYGVIEEQPTYFVHRAVTAGLGSVLMVIAALSKPTFFEVGFHLFAPTPEEQLQDEHDVGILPLTEEVKQRSALVLAPAVQYRSRISVSRLANPDCVSFKRFPSFSLQ
ncbi:hypothetical protein C8R41DRAFT_902941 [Lentinula lateritia]|uniref:Uncharacterized protein n=1 Tax=Lentinula lateritia TaxID=40482 RepID=A0ABQ8VFL6_9AGAR|nr:hypothetical protein C8R41DRAFT_902941 [Lentinula lateritia]